jgi:hypothetical protein
MPVREDRLDLRELLSIPYLLEGEAVETESGKWLVRLAYPLWTVRDLGLSSRVAALLASTAK